MGYLRLFSKQKQKKEEEDKEKEPQKIKRSLSQSLHSNKTKTGTFNKHVSCIIIEKSERQQRQLWGRGESCWGDISNYPRKARMGQSWSTLDVLVRLEQAETELLY